MGNDILLAVTCVKQGKPGEDKPRECLIRWPTFHRAETLVKGIYNVIESWLYIVWYERGMSA